MKMLKVKRSIFLVLATYFILMAGCACIFAEEEGEAKRTLLENTGVEISADIAIYSKYMWRGFKLDKDPVMQSGVYIDCYGIDASAWGSFDIDSDDMFNSDEVDYQIGYTYDVSKAIKELPLSLTGGYIYYDFPPANAHTHEFYIGASFDILLSPAITWYHDFGNVDTGGGDGDYIIGEVSHGFPIGDMPISFDLSMEGGYNHKDFLEGDGGYVDFGAGLTFKLFRNCTLQPNIGYTMPFGNLKDENDGNQDDEFYGGAVLAFNF